jgi:hypothetical protein
MVGTSPLHMLELDKHVRGLLTDVAAALAPTHSRYGVGVSKDADGTLELHLGVRARTKGLKSDLGLALRNFRVDTVPASGPVGAAFRVTAYAGGTARVGYEYSAEDDAALRALVGCLDDYSPCSDLTTTLVGRCRASLCERPAFEVTSERLFAADAEAFLVALLTAEHQKLSQRVRGWIAGCP